MQPLSGIKVVEFTNIASGPFCGMLLSDMGAEVIKIEKPGGDDMRQWPPVTDGYSENFASVNRNKRSIVMNLKDPEDLELALQICADADVVVENNRPGAMNRLGLGYEDMKARNKALIYCSISAFGTDGPYSKQAGFDLIIQAASGIMSVTGDENEVKCGVPISDFATGLYGAFAIVSALREAEKTGEGVHIDSSMMGASMGIAALQTSTFFGTGTMSPLMGNRHPRNAPYQAFKASDGSFVMAAGNNKLFQTVCEVTGRMELFDDPDYATTTLRAANQTKLAATLEVEFAKRTVDEWIEALGGAGLPIGPINSYEQALSHPQVEHAGWVQDMELPNGVKTKTFGSPIRFNQETTAMRSAPPALDSDGAILRTEYAARKAAE